MAVSCKQIAEMAGVSRQAAASVLNGAEKCLVSNDICCGTRNPLETDN